MSDDDKNERRSPWRSSNLGSELAAGPPSSRRPPDLDAVFRTDDGEPEEEDTRTVRAVDALGRPSFELDDETVVMPLDSAPEPSVPSSRLSAPPGAAVSLRAKVDAPPMAVPSIRAPAAAPPPFAGRSPFPTQDLTEDGETAYDHDAEADVFDDDLESEPEAAELEEAEFYSEPVHDPAADPARALRASASPREKGNTEESSELAELFKSARPSSSAGPRSIPPAPIGSPRVSRPPAPPSMAPTGSGSLRPSPSGSLRPSPSGSLRPSPSGSLRPPSPGSLRPPSPGSLRPPPSGSLRPPSPGSLRPPPSGISSTTPVGSAPPSMPIGSALPPPVDVLAAPKTLVSAPPRSAVPLPPEPPEDFSPRQSNRRGWVWGVLLLGLILLGGAFWMIERSQPGSLLITVVGPGNQPVSGLRLYLDGQLVCRTSPCDVAQLEQGTHLVRAEAEGFPATAEQAVVVGASERAVHNIALEAGGGRTRLGVATEIAGFRVLLDGKEVGITPLQLEDVAPGEHVVELIRDGFETHRERVDLEAGELRSLGPLSPALSMGTLVLKGGPGAQGAEVRVNGNKHDLPAETRLSANEAHVIVATKAGYGRFEKEVRFDEKEPLQEVVIELTKTEDDGALERPEVAGGSEPKKSPSQERGAMAKLNFNSIPSSTVVLDGRPIGQTPRMGISVSPGRHNVVFVHPERGRKSAQVDVDAGESRTVSVRF